LRKRSKKNSWIKSLLALGLKPRLEVLELIHLIGDDVIDKRRLSEAEVFWIAVFRVSGAELKNGTDGGDGGGGFKHRPETIAYLRTINSGERNNFFGRQHSPEFLERNRLMCKGERSPMYDKKQSLETIALRSGEKNGFFGKQHSPEFLAVNRVMCAGERSSKAKLTWTIVDEIRERWGTPGGDYKTLMIEFGVSSHTIYDIVKYKSWKLDAHPRVCGG
jgi:hypothetical protein